MRCMRCGYEIEDTAKFCRYCGWPINPSELERPTRPATAHGKGGGIRILLISVLAVLVLAAAFLTLVLTGVFDLSPDRAGEDDRIVDAEGGSRLVDFAADKSYFYENEAESVCFTVSVAGEQPEYVELCLQGKEAARMHDDGQDGDVLAGDGVYTAVLSVQHSFGVYDYYARCEGAASEPASLYFFQVPTQESIQQIEQYEEHIQQLEDSLSDASGFVAEENCDEALQQVADYAQMLYEKDEVFFYEASEDSVLIKFKNGLTYVYVPECEGMDAGGEEAVLSVYTFQPCQSSFPASIQEELRLPDEAAETLNGLSGCAFAAENNLDEQQVTLERVRNLGSNQVIIWQGHGGYSSSLHAFVVTGEAFDMEKWRTDEGYRRDNMNERIVNCSSGNVAFTAGYIEKYCGDLSGTILYLGTCHSGHDDTLANAFLQKGAVAVVGNTDTVYTVYDLYMSHETFINMASNNDQTGALYTLGEALAMAKTIYGENDSAYGSKKNVATPVIFGGQGAENFRFENSMEALGVSLADGSYVVELGPEDFYVSDGYMYADVDILSYVYVDDSVVKGLQEGDAIDLSEFGEGVFEVFGTLYTSGDPDYGIPACLDIGSGLLYEQEDTGNWMLTWPSDVPVTYRTGETATVRFAKDVVVRDAGGMTIGIGIDNSYQEYFPYERTLEMAIEDGNVYTMRFEQWD